MVAISATCKRSGLIPGFFDFMQNASLENMPKPLQEAYLIVAPDPTHLQVMHDKDRDRMINFKDWPDSEIKSIKAPTLLINADHDVILNEHALEMSRLIPHAELMILPGVHGSFLGEVCTGVKGSKIPELTVGMIEEFLRK